MSNYETAMLIISLISLIISINKKTEIINSL